ncbi:hypothetical protein [Streptomyces sp. NPDC054783]
MASRASSEAPDARVPARIPSLNGLGTSWYERGTGYWLRRVRLAVLMLAVLAFLCFAAVELYTGFRTVLPSGVRPVWDWAQVAGACAALPWGWVVQRRQHRGQLLDPPEPDEFRSRKSGEVRRTAGLAYVGRGLLVLAAPVLPALAGFAVGWSAGMLTVREYPSEVGARRWLEAHPTGP